MSGGFRRREVVLACGEVRPYDPAAWHDAIVRVEDGQVELETADGARRRFGHGAVLCLAGLPLRVLRNPGPGLVTLIAISRNRTDSFSSEAPSYNQEHDIVPEAEKQSCP
ncbi:hypothetical protein [Streptosporangium minutum]|uniref:hypothetical protein n=1 Tax=Streptosporangium minutum TaxID=569862 RepID=UPI001A996319|nr:hypothetical protein [Streptosporangium minutum]